MARLGDLLVEHGVMSAEQLEQAESHRQENGGNLAQSVVGLGLASEADLVRVFAQSIGMPYADLDAIDPVVAGLLPAELARAHTALPVRFGDDDEVVVAIADPSAREELYTALSEAMGVRISLALAPRRALVQAIEAMVEDEGGAAEPRPAAGSVPPPPSASKPADPSSPVNGAAPATGDAQPGPGGPDLDAPAPPAAPRDPAGAGDRPRGVRATSPSPSSQPLVQAEETAAVDLDELLVALVERGGSDLHLTAGIPPALRINGELAPMDDYDKLTPDELQKMIYAIMTQKQRETFENELELDMSYSVPKLARFRVNVFQQRDSLGAVMRVIPFEILPLEDLGIPEQVSNFAYMPRGFVLVTGPTGSGKSTTLASLIDLANRNRASHIVTVEDPIEFLHSHKRSVVNQREVGTDTHGFAAALKHVLRQDPDIILVGEMRDLETIQIALTAAETGHLVFGTLHTQDAPQSIDRIIDVFPPHQQEQIRVMLSGALKGVVCQTLLKTADGSGRTAACEVMVSNSGIKNLIREGKTHQIYSAIQAGARDGMVAMDQSLAKLVKSGTVTYDAALEKCNQPNEFNRLVGRT
ncbi:MAG: PilT/PilU family type 4a pilus ATPase [Nitriliruptoraceae bacterium]